MTKHLTCIYSRIMMLAILGGMFLILSACSGPKAEMKTVFFPPLPEEPHVQFLTAISDSSFLEQKSLFKSLVSGMDKPDILTRLLKPYGIGLYKDVIYVCDTVPNTVFRIDLKAKTFESIRGNSGSGSLKKPVGLAIDEEGVLYVADSIRNEVLLYTSEGDFLKAVGKGFLTKPVGVAVDKEMFYVLDSTERLIKVFDRKTGSMVKEFGKEGAKGDNLVLPVGIAIDPQGFLYATNVGTGKVLKYDVDGHVILSFGKIGDFLGEFSRPKGIAVGKGGRIYVTDAGNQNVQIFNAEKQLLLGIGMPGLPRGSLNLPAGITVVPVIPEYFRQYVDPLFEPDELIFVTNQSGNELISVYAIGRYKGKFTPPPALPTAPPQKPAEPPVKPAVPAVPGPDSGNPAPAPEKPAAPSAGPSALTDQGVAANGVAAQR